MEYEPVIGLEIHTELATRTKMFCDSLNDPDEKHPNINICPVCLGHPGTLPTINKEAVEKVLLVGMALHAEIPEFSQFDRKNYFYPDLPKGYQISQYQHPLVRGGALEFRMQNSVSRIIRITRVHLEEDTGRLIHDPKTNMTLVDFNRAGIPLMELVTEPDLKSAAEARGFAEELQLMIRCVGASDADMEKGEFRVEANVSLRPAGSKELGTKVELKNINSFKFVASAIEYEIKRQAEVLSRGEKVAQETRGWDDARGITVPQRLKEGATDYRYFPEPDLPPLVLDQNWLREIRAKLPELPAARRERFVREYGLDEKTAEMFVRDPALAQYFEEAAKSKSDPVIRSIANTLVGDFQRLLNETGAEIREIPVTPENFAKLNAYFADGAVSSAAVKSVLDEMFRTGEDPEKIIRKKGLIQESSKETLAAIADRVIQENSSIAEAVKSGKANAIQALVGAAMKASAGKANPSVLRELFLEKLGKNG